MQDSFLAHADIFTNKYVVHYEVAECAKMQPQERRRATKIAASAVGLLAMTRNVAAGRAEKMSLRTQ